MPYKYKSDQSKRDKEYRRSISNHCVYLFELPDGKMYVGSTDLLTYRLNTHRQKSKKTRSKLYEAINEVGWQTVRVHILVKNIPNKKIRLSIEQYFVEMIPKNMLLNTDIKCR